MTSVEDVKDKSRLEEQHFELRVYWKEVSKIETFNLKCRNLEQIKLWKARLDVCIKRAKSYGRPNSMDEFHEMEPNSPMNPRSVSLHMPGFGDTISQMRGSVVAPHRDSTRISFGLQSRGSSTNGSLQGYLVSQEFQKGNLIGKRPSHEVLQQVGERNSYGRPPSDYMSQNLSNTQPSADRSQDSRNDTNSRISFEKMQIHPSAKNNPSDQPQSLRMAPNRSSYVSIGSPPPTTSLPPAPQMSLPLTPPLTSDHEPTRSVQLPRKSSLIGLRISSDSMQPPTPMPTLYSNEDTSLNVNDIPASSTFNYISNVTNVNEKNRISASNYTSAPPPNIPLPLPPFFKEATSSITPARPSRAMDSLSILLQNITQQEFAENESITPTQKISDGEIRTEKREQKAYAERRTVKNKLGTLIKVKTHHQKDIFILALPRDCSFTDLKEKIERKILLSGLETEGIMRLRYVDEEGDSVSICDDGDVAIAFELHGGAVHLYAEFEKI